MLSLQKKKTKNTQPGNRTQFLDVEHLYAEPLHQPRFYLITVNDIFENCDVFVFSVISKIIYFNDLSRFFSLENLSSEKLSFGTFWDNSR